jgi:hypothetical protein
MLSEIFPIPIVMLKKPCDPAGFGRLNSYLNKIGFTIVNTSIVASIEFPPR